MNRAQHRAFKQAQKRNERKVRRAKKREMPRCPVCQNQVAESDRVQMQSPSGVERVIVHATCATRIEQARQLQTAERVKEQGIWLPGSE